MNTQTKTISLGQYVLIHCEQEFDEAVAAVLAEEALTYDGSTPTSYPVLGFFCGGDEETFFFDEVPHALALDLVIARYGSALRAIMDDLVG